MKKKLILMAMLTAMLAIVLTGCPPEPVQKKILVTGIPANADWNIGFVGLAKGSTVVAVSMPASIAGNRSLTAELVDSKGSPFTDEGTYTFVLMIYSEIRSDSKGDIDDAYQKWAGGKPNQSIKDEVTTIAYSNLVKIDANVSTLQFKQLLEELEK